MIEIELEEIEPVMFETRLLTIVISTILIPLPHLASFHPQYWEAVSPHSMSPSKYPLISAVHGIVKTRVHPRERKL